MVVDYVREGILTGRLEPGERLNIGELAVLLNVSHTPTREAFQHLAAEGLLWINAYRGAYVTKLSADEYEEIFLMRIGIEGLAARLGAESMDKAGTEAMRKHLADMTKAARRGDIDTFVEVDREFHRAHYCASGRERLWERIISLRYVAERYTRLSYSLVDLGMSDVVKSHTEILHAVERRDGDAAERLVVSDLRRTYEAVLRELRAERN